MPCIDSLGDADGNVWDPFALELINASDEADIKRPKTATDGAAEVATLGTTKLGRLRLRTRQREQLQRSTADEPPEQPEVDPILGSWEQVAREELQEWIAAGRPAVVVRGSPPLGRHRPPLGHV